MIWRLRFSFIISSARKFLTNNTYNAEIPMSQVISILKKLRDHLSDIKLASDINYCIDAITSGFICKNCENYKDSAILESEILKGKKQLQKKTAISEVKKNIQNSVDKFDISNEFGLSSDAIIMLDEVHHFDFNIFDLHKETNGNEMVTLTTYLVYKHNLFVDLTIDLNTFGMFIRNIQEGYHDVAYHNKIHGMDVGRLAYYYATTCGLMDKAKWNNQDLFCFIVGGAIHDFEHLGWNNAYLIETQHEWAVTYNDISVCENHHVAAAFELMKNNNNNEWNIFEHTSLEDFKKMRKKMTQMVLATDMAYHFEHLDKFKKLIENSSADLTEDKNKLFLMCMTLHLSDLTNPTKNWFESYKWACLVNEEFFVQGDIEKELGLNGSPFNDRNSVNLAEAQVGFINLFIQPTFDIFAMLLPKVKHQWDQLKSNSEKWKNMTDEWRKLKEDGNDLIKLFHKVDDTINELRFSKKIESLKKTREETENID